MRLVRWNPLQEMVTLRNAMDRMLDESFARSLGETTEYSRAGLPISIDMYDQNGSLIIKTELPGIKAEDIDLRINGDSLTIQGEFKAEEDTERENFHIMERRYGKFHRTISLPSNVDKDSVDATFEDGVLELSLLKSEETMPKQISIKSKS